MSSTGSSTTGGSADTAAGDSAGQGDQATQPPAFVDELAAEGDECKAGAGWLRAQFVLDGDTIVVDDGSWSKVRLLGVAAPEISHPPKPAECYGAASFSLAKKWLQIEQPNLTNVYVCMLKDSKSDNKDAFGRLLRYVYLRDSAGTPVQLNARLIRMGAARVYREYSKGLRFETALIARENAAKSEKLGGWSQCNWSPLK
jgi:micrococcal nuclease